MKQIKASEIKPGMTIRWEQEDLVLQFPVARSIQFGNGHLLRTPMRKVVTIPPDTPVTVLSDPAPAQPEEPTEFGARVVVDGVCFVRRGAAHLRPWENDAATVFNWREVTRLGEVTVIDADPYWTVPEDAPVPERIEEWDTWDDVPEGVVVTVPGLFCHYRKNQGAVEFSDPDDDPEWTEPGVRAMPRGYGPWTRVADV